MKALVSFILGFMLFVGLLVGIGYMASDSRHKADDRCKTAFGQDWSATSGKGASAPDCVNGNGEAKWLR